MRAFAVEVCLILLGFCGAAQAQSGSGPAASQFQLLSGMIGDWRAKEPPYPDVTSSNQMISTGTVVLESFQVGKDPAMTSQYYLSHGKLLMTHYCSAGNQPHMQADPPGKNPNVIHFSLIGIDNLKNPEDGHMVELIMTFVDKNHYKEEWTWHERGREKDFVFRFKRI